jgi:hypothetical protein
MKQALVADDLSLACQRVGRFLHGFALLEHELNARIIEMLRLQGEGADVLAHGLDFAKKLNLLRTIAVVTAPSNDKKRVETLFSAIFEMNNDRILMAHCPFEPAGADAVQFRRTVAKDGKVNVKDPLWPSTKFDSAYANLENHRQALGELKPRLIIKIDENGRSEILSKYFYAPILWAPSTESTLY